MSLFNNKTVLESKLMRTESRATELHNYTTVVVQSASLLKFRGHEFDRRHQEDVHRYGQAVIGLDMLQSLYLDLLGRSWNSTAATVTRQRYELVRPRPRLQTESHSTLVLSGILTNKIKGAAKAFAKEHIIKGRQYMYAGAALVVINALLVVDLEDDETARVRLAAGFPGDVLCLRDLRRVH